MASQRYKCVVQYDGTHYVGFQIQKNGVSVQEKLQQTLKKMSKGLLIQVEGSGRTDSGVHAKGQVIHFDYPVSIEPIHVQRAMNSILPDDIQIVSVQEVPDTFHARFSAVGKKYQYRVDLNRFVDPFKRLYTLHHPYRMDLSRMQRALLDVIGTHDFTSFCSTKAENENKVRTVYEASVVLDETTNELLFTFVGSGFLYNMVRIFVGTSLQIADGLKPENELARLIEVGDRKQAGPTAPGHGLYLMEVYYDDLFKQKYVNKGEEHGKI